MIFLLLHLYFFFTQLTIQKNQRQNTIDNYGEKTTGKKGEEGRERRGRGGKGRKIADRWSRSVVDVVAAAGTLPTAVDC